MSKPINVESVRPSHDSPIVVTTRRVLNTPSDLYGGISTAAECVLANDMRDGTIAFRVDGVEVKISLRDVAQYYPRSLRVRDGA